MKKATYKITTESGHVTTWMFTESHNKGDYGNGNYISIYRVEDIELIAYIDLRYQKYVFETFCETYIKQYFGDNLLSFERILKKGKGDYMGEIIVTVNEYIKEHIEFANRHVENGPCKIETTYARSGNGLRKVFRWEDGARWYEVTELTENGWRTEYWSSENGDSKVFYERD